MKIEFPLCGQFIAQLQGIAKVVAVSAMVIGISPRAFSLANGVSVLASDSPSTVRIVFDYWSADHKTAYKNWYCSASKIGRRTFLTAAHCVYKNTPGRQVQIGQQSDHQNGTTVEVSAIVVAVTTLSGYAEGRSENDVGLVEIDRDTPGIAIAKIPPPGSPFYNGPYFVAAYGRISGNETDPMSNPLRATVLEKDDDFGPKKFGTESISLAVNNDFAMWGKGRIRQGDSGAGVMSLAFNKDRQPASGIYVVGVISMSILPGAGQVTAEHLAGISVRLDKANVYQYVTANIDTSLRK